MSTIRWAPRDQVELDALIKRKAAFENQSMVPLLEVASYINVGGMHTDHEIAMLLRNHADELRDALKPFDSGIRVGTTDRAA